MAEEKYLSYRAENCSTYRWKGFVCVREESWRLWGCKGRMPQGSCTENCCLWTYFDYLNFQAVIGGTMRRMEFKL